LLLTARSLTGLLGDVDHGLLGVLLLHALEHLKALVGARRRGVLVARLQHARDLEGRRGGRGRGGRAGRLRHRGRRGGHVGGHVACGAVDAVAQLLQWGESMRKRESIESVRDVKRGVKKEEKKTGNMMRKGK